MGSTKSVLFGISVLADRLHIPLEEILRMSSLNAARFYGFGTYKGSIAIGKDADLLVIDDQYEVVDTYVEGRKVYDASKEKGFFKQDYLSKFKAD